jgi:protein-tyrosine phosphatase
MNNKEIFWNNAEFNIFKISDGIYQGAYPNVDACKHLKKLEIGAILNVSGGSVRSCDDSEINCLSIPFPDGELIPIECIKTALDYIHDNVDNGVNIFVHCLAGQNRSATILWLYYVSVYKDLEKSYQQFLDKTLDAVPGHPKLVGKIEIAFAMNYKRNPPNR